MKELLKKIQQLYPKKGKIVSSLDPHKFWICGSNTIWSNDFTIDNKAYLFVTIRKENIITCLHAEISKWEKINLDYYSELVITM